MYFDRFVSLLGILTLTLAAAGTNSTTVWVAPNEGECQGRAPCGMLQNLWLSEAGVNIINESNTTWVFLPGLHSLNSTAGSLILFWRVSNIVLTGDELCVRKKEECTIVCANYLCIFLFIGSRNVTIQHISVTYNNGSYLPLLSYCKWKVSHLLSPFCHQLCFSNGNITGICSEVAFNLSVTSWMFVWSANVHLCSLHLVGYNSEITVYNPREQFEVIGCHFSQLPPATDQKAPRHSLALVISPSSKVAESVHVLVSGCTYEAQQYFPHISPSSVISYYNHHAVLVQITGNRSELQMRSLSSFIEVNATIDACTFLRTSGVSVQLSESPDLLATVQIMNSLINGMALEKSINVSRFMLLEGSGVKIQLLAGHWDLTQLLNSSDTCHEPACSHIVVSGNVFQNLASTEGIGVSLQTVYNDRQDLCDCKVPVIIENNNFTHNRGLRYGSIIDATHTWPNGSNVFTDYEHELYIHPALVLRNNSFSRSITAFSTCFDFYVSPDNDGHVAYTTRWNIDQECTAGDPGKGVVHLSGFRGSYFAALVDNTILNNAVMGLSVINSQVLFNGSNTLSDNYAPYGGGIFLGDGSQMLLSNGTQLVLLQNTASFTGGGIFVSPVESQLAFTTYRQVPPALCFFDLVASDGQLVRNVSSLTDLNVNVTLSENRALISGSSLFVSSMIPCYRQRSLQDESEVFSKVFHLPNSSDEREMSSLPSKICSCNEGGPIDCFLSPIRVFPGQNLYLWLSVAGEANISLSGVITLFISLIRYPEFNPLRVRNAVLFKYATRLSSSCNKITIAHESIAELATGEYFILPSYPILDNTPFASRQLNLLTSINMTVLDHCPHGYNLINTGPGPLCECHNTLQDRHITCSLDTLSFVLPPRYWIGTSSDNTSLQFSDNCLPVYCRDVYESKNVSLSNLTHHDQCLHGRVGTLCGECPEGQSVMLWSYNCKSCPNYGILVVAPFLVAGPLLIIFICFFNWTVSARSSNGLLFYLNVISINSDVLNSRSFAFVVISWLNFQAGFEMCLYDGMDEFAKTFLSFAFPLYLLSLVALIVIVSKCINMHRINELIGPRITPVLVTVIFLSYAMLSNSVLNSLLFARLYSTDGGFTPVWLLDGSLKYFRSTKHLILACMALLVLFVLLIPITLIALIGDLFRRCISNRWYMNFLDTFHSSYRFRWGFWMGIRLLLRVVLLFLKVNVKPEVLWLVTACFSLSLAAVQSLLKPFRYLRFDRFSHRLVDEWCSSEENGRTAANYLDISFLVNLTALFLCISYLPESAEVFISLSLCVALLELLLILAYHLVEYSPLWPPLLRATTRAVKRMRMFVQSMRHNEEQQHEEGDTHHVLQGLPLVLRAEDCHNEEYESSVEESEEEEYEACK